MRSNDDASPDVCAHIFLLFEVHNMLESGILLEMWLIMVPCSSFEAINPDIVMHAHCVMSP